MAVLGFAPGLTWLFIARIWSGIATGNIAVAQAYIADVTPPERRARGMAIIGIAFGLGFIFGPFIGGELSRFSIEGRPGMLPPLVAAGLSTINLLLAFRTLFPWLTVQKNVMFGLEVGKRSSRGEAEEEAQLWLQLVGLTKFASAYPHQLSGGMKQRVAIARALANRPRILLMDEPFGALDAQTRCQMQSYLLQIWKQVDITVLFITHDLDEAVYLADRILILDAHPGRVRELMEVPVPRPRTPDQFMSPAFIAARHHLEELIHPRSAQATDTLPLFRMTVVGDDVE